MQSRREFLKSAAGLGVLALASSCPTKTTKDSLDYVSQNPNFSDFTRYLGKEWDSLSQDKQNETRKLWKEATEADKEGVFDIYKHPEKHYRSLDKDVRENIDAVLKYQKYQNFEKQGITEKDYQDLVDFSTKVPWINPQHFTRKDLIFLGEVGEAIAAAVMSH